MFFFGYLKEKMNSTFEDFLMQKLPASKVNEKEEIQSLWSGYGKISRYELEASTRKSVVVKCIDLGAASSHPRGWNTDHSHNRKVKSYEIETHWYRYWSSKCTGLCKVPEFLGFYNEGEKTWIVLEDLKENYPHVVNELNLKGIKLCLDWLANFHACFLDADPRGLWPIGTYWHLETRPDELREMPTSELKAKAHLIDEALNDCRYKTIVHGDAKLANFCFSANLEKAAAVDFQYVGGGCGMKDVVYFLGSCLHEDELEEYEEELLAHYFDSFRSSLSKSHPEIDSNEVEQEWREMYPIASTDFLRFLMGWMPGHWKINGYNRRIMDHVLEKL